MYRKIALTALMALVLLPGAATAHDTGDDNSGRGRGLEVRAAVRGNLFENFRKRLHAAVEDRDRARKQRSVSGSVTAVSSNGFTLTTKNDTAFTVIVNGDTEIIDAFTSALALGDITVDDSASVKGELEDATITASKIVITPANTHRAKARGTVTEVSDDSFTIESSARGVVYSVEVNTTASTTIRSLGATSTATTTATVEVGDHVKVKGLWDEVLNILNAIKIFIFK